MFSHKILGFISLFSNVAWTLLMGSCYISFYKLFCWSFFLVPRSLLGL